MLIERRVRKPMTGLWNGLTSTFFLRKADQQAEHVLHKFIGVGGGHQRVVNSVRKPLGSKSSPPPHLAPDPDPKRPRSAPRPHSALHKSPPVLTSPRRSEIFSFRTAGDAPSKSSCPRKQARLPLRSSRPFCDMRTEQRRLSGCLAELVTTFTSGMFTYISSHAA